MNTDAIENDIDRYIELAEDALSKGDVHGAIEQARFAARAVGKLVGLNLSSERDLPVSSNDAKVRQLFSRISEVVPRGGA